MTVKRKVNEHWKQRKYENTIYYIRKNENKENVKVQFITLGKKKTKKIWKYNLLYRRYNDVISNIVNAMTSQDDYRMIMKQLLLASTLAMIKHRYTMATGERENVAMWLWNMKNMNEKFINQSWIYRIMKLYTWSCYWFVQGN